MIPRDTSYAIVVNDIIIAKGNKKQMMSLRKKTPGANLWLTGKQVGEVLKHEVQ